MRNRSLVACVIVCTLLFQSTTAAFAGDLSNHALHARHLAKQALIRPVNGLKGLGMGAVMGGFVGLYLANALSVAPLPRQCVHHARYIATISGGPLCYAAWIPLFGLSAPIGLAGDIALGAPLGTLYGLKESTL